MPLPEADAQTWRVQIVAPSGRNISVHGFRDRERVLVRFSPEEVGTHHFRLQRVEDAGLVTVSKGAFEVVPGTDPVPPSFARIEPARPEQFSQEDGARIFLLGENRFNVYDPSWNYQNKSIEEYVAYMASHGENGLRLFVFNDCEGEQRPQRDQPGCLEPKLGQYDDDVARDFDRIFTAAERHGVYVILTVFAVGFTPGDVWKGWDDNPYNSARGGIVATPSEFFTSPAARELQKRRLDYVIDRYGAYRSLFAVDLLNEPEWDGEIGEATWLPWAEDLARHVRARDPYQHLITVGSVGLHSNIDGDERAWYASPENDFVQWHLYGEETHDPHALAAELTRKVDETRGFGKPIVVGDFGHGGEDKTTFEHTHVGIWSSTFHGAGVLAHSAPVFESDSDQAMVPERAAHFATLREVLDRLGDAREIVVQSEHNTVLNAEGARALALGDALRRVVWVMGPKEGYGAPVERAGLEMRELPCHDLRARFRDDVSGHVLAERVLAPEPMPDHPARCRARTELPAFVRHVVAEVDSLHLAPHGTP